MKVKFGMAQRYIGAELDKAAARLGMPREELEEMSVPAYGLDDTKIKDPTITLTLQINAM